MKLKHCLHVALIASLFHCSQVLADKGWADDPAWYDGLAEKAVYSATRVVYGKPRAYEAIFFTNKEQHDQRTLTKAEKSDHTVEVWKFNEIENIPTPNYTYHYVTTTHLTTAGMDLTRSDCSSQEFCGTSFKQFLRPLGSRWIDYWSFSYMPEAGRVEAKLVAKSRPMIPQDALPLYLRGLTSLPTGQETKLDLLPSQKSNGPTPHEAVEVRIRSLGQDGDSVKFEARDRHDKLLGTYWMALDRRHVMLRYVSGDGQQTYTLKTVDRVNYWSLPPESPAPGGTPAGQEAGGDS